MTAPITNQILRLYQYTSHSSSTQGSVKINHATGSKHLTTVKNKPASEGEHRTSLKKSLAMVLSAKHKRVIHPSSLGKQTKISEQELFAALAHHKLSDINPALGEKFARQLPTALANCRRLGSTPSLLQATSCILRNMLRNHNLTQAQFREIRAYALGKAQLDTNRIDVAGPSNEAAYKGTASQLGVEQAIQRTITNKVASESEVAAFRALSAKESRDKQSVKQQTRLSRTNTPVHIVSPGTVSNHRPTGPQDFLWKPYSDSDGNLVILLPTAFADDALSVEVLSADGKILATGKLVGYFSDSRPIFRFTKPGASFPAQCVVQIVMRDGGIKRITIGNPAERNVVNCKP